MEQRQVSLQAGEFVFLEAGAGGRPLMLVHGFTGSKEDFADELDRLAADGFHAIAPELRGHGDSVWFDDESAYSLEAYTADMWELVDRLGWHRFSLLGHSMGGMIAQMMAISAPERLEALVLMDTHHGSITGIDEELLDAALDVVRHQGLGVLHELLKFGADPAQNPAFERTCAERPGYREWAENKMLNTSPAMYAAMIRQLPTVVDRLDELEGLFVPTLVMVGELDVGFVEPSKRLSERIPNARLDVLADGGHCPQFEATEAWRASLSEFLTAVVSGTDAVVVDL